LELVVVWSVPTKKISACRAALIPSTLGPHIQTHDIIRQINALYSNVSYLSIWMSNVVNHFASALDCAYFQMLSQETNTPLTLVCFYWVK